MREQMPEMGRIKHREKSWSVSGTGTWRPAPFTYQGFNFEFHSEDDRALHRLGLTFQPVILHLTSVTDLRLSGNFKPEFPRRFLLMGVGAPLDWWMNLR